MKQTKQVILQNSATLEAQFSAVLESHKKLIFKIANAYCQDPVDRQDLVQEIALQLWKAFPNYNPEYALSTWIYRISLNVAISFLRKEKRRKKNLVSGEPLIELVPQSEEEDTLSRQVEQLYQFIGQLKPLDKALMILYLEKTRQEEIAEVLGITASNVSTRVGRIKKKLRDYFNTLKNEDHGI